MRSDLQNQASRTNGRKSRGPVTEEGKLASSRNAIKHGVLSECIVLPGESEESFQSLTEDLFEEHRPVGSTEEDLVEMMAVARWRRMRIWSLEKACLTNRMVTEYRDARAPRAKVEDVAGRAFASLANETRTLDLVSRYESRYDRQYFRAHRRLLELQDRRMPNEPDNPPPASPSDPRTAPTDSSSAPVTPGVSAGNTSSAKRSQEVIENARGGLASRDISERTQPAEGTIPAKRGARLPHWHSAFTPLENIVDPLPLQPLEPESPEKAGVFAV